MPLKIYYLDDEEALCENFRDYFSSKDAVVTTFVDPQIAIEAIRKDPPDLFFIDYRLPGATGDEVARAVDPKLPKFLITGDISVRTEYEFERVFSKPYDEAAIAELISAYISSRTAS